MTDDADGDFDDDTLRRPHGDRSALIALGLSEAMRSRAGRTWLWSLLSGAGLDANTFVTDPIHSAYLTGRRAVAVELMAEIRRTCPDQYLTMIRESLEK